MSDLVPFGLAVASARRRHRSALTALRRWALSGGVRLDVDLVALVLEVDSERVRRHRDEGRTRYAVYWLMRGDIPNWCSIRRCLTPEDVPETIWHWLHYLDVTGGLGGADEPLGELLKPLLCYGGLDFAGRRRREGDTRKLVECECFEPDGVGPDIPVSQRGTRAARRAPPPAAARRGSARRRASDR